jgi:hypothetical protein
MGVVAGRGGGLLLLFTTCSIPYPVSGVRHLYTVYRCHTPTVQRPLYVCTCVGPAALVLHGFLRTRTRTTYVRVMVRVRVQPYSKHGPDRWTSCSQLVGAQRFVTLLIKVVSQTGLARAPY